MLSVADGKLRKIATCGLPFLSDVGDAGGRWAPAAPGEQFLKLLWLAFGNDFHAAVLGVADPSDQPHGCGGLLSVHSKKDALDVAGDVKMHSLHGAYSIYRCFGSQL